MTTHSPYVMHSHACPRDVREYLDGAVKGLSFHPFLSTQAVAYSCSSRVIIGPGTLRSAPPDSHLLSLPVRWPSLPVV